MAKHNNKSTKKQDTVLDFITDLDQPDTWEFTDAADERFWEEFFQIEEILETTDELDPPAFSITVQNEHTGEVKTFSNIHLRSAKKKIIC